MRGKVIFWFDEVGRESSQVVGGKCANLGAMIQMGMRVPPGFAISAEAYQWFIEDTGVALEISHYIESLGKIEGIKQLEETSRTIRTIIESKGIPEDLKEKISLAYRTLCAKVGIPDVPVAVRSSGLVEDSASASYAGQFETFLNVKGEVEVVDKVKKVWSSSFTTRAIGYRAKRGIPVGAEVLLGVGVLKMVNPRCAGIGFTIDPVSGSTSKIIIEANWGLGEGVVSGATQVDRYVVDKDTLEIKESTIGNKETRVVSKEKGTIIEEVAVDKRLISCMADEEVKEVSRLAKLLEEQLGSPQDIEWAIDNDLLFPQNVVLLQTRPVTAIVKKSATDKILDLMLSRLYRR
ncbi:MAG: PEP/pyruvate-binding domain-containing protein [Thermodesulfobacteriota bacterium]